MLQIQELLIFEYVAFVTQLHVLLENVELTGHDTHEAFNRRTLLLMHEHELLVFEYVALVTQPQVLLLYVEFVGQSRHAPLDWRT